MKREKLLDVIIGIVAISMCVYHLVNCYFSIVGSIEHRMIHLALGLVLVFLTSIKLRKGPLVLILVLLITLSIFGYLLLNLERLLFYLGFPLLTDVIVGFAVICIVFLACWLSFGITLPLVSTMLLIYGLLCRYIGGPIISVEEIITAVVLVFDGYSLWGKVLTISANVIFLFTLYGGLLQGIKATNFFVQVGRIIGRYTRSGPAMAAVVSSALMGMTAGQATPNIAVTGAFTIPLMKKVGYKPEVAGAIEAAASGGGQIMPPIMGAGAFVMADMLNVPYARIITLAIIPAILYFFSVSIFVHLHALKGNVMPLEEKVDMKEIYAFGPLFIFPLIVILALLFLGFPPMFSAFWGITSLIVLSLIKKETRPSLGRILAGCVQGAKTGARIAVACATLGPIISLMTKTGLGLKIGYSVEIWCGGSIFLGLLIMMVSIIILGLEVPTVAAYLIAAIVAIPCLVRLGLNPFQAHMFAFYFGAFSGLTPPIGMSAIVAAKMANAPYIPTALHSVAAAATAFLIPFVFVYNGALLLLPGTNLSSVLISIAVVLVGLGIFQIGFVGYFLTRLPIWERALAIISGLGFLMFVAVGNYFALLISAILFISVILLNLRKSSIAKA